MVYNTKTSSFFLLWQMREIFTVFDRYATDVGYWSDEFIKYFCRSAEKKPPEISRGIKFIFMSKVFLLQILTHFLTEKCYTCQSFIQKVKGGYPPPSLSSPSNK